VSTKHEAGVLAFVVAVASSVPAGAGQQSTVGPTDRQRNAAIELSAVAREQAVSKPVRQLFTIQAATPPDPLHFQERLRDLARHTASPIKQSRTVCGLTIWDIDPDLDPRMRLTPPQPPNVTYTIQKITPPLCGE